MINDNTDFYYCHGDLSYDFDEEHQDHELADIEFSLIKKYLAHVSNSLHLFCGAGRHVLLFSWQNIHSIGIDISWYLIHRAKILMEETKCVRGKVVCGDVLNLPLHANSFQCVTALGNSICLLNNEQVGSLFAQAYRVMDRYGIFVIDLPDYNYLIDQKGLVFNSSSRSKEFVSKKFGPGVFTWKRIHDPGKKMIFSSEQIIFHQGEDKETKYENRFSFNIIYPGEMVKIANACNMEHIDTIFHEDHRGIYKGMLKKRVFMVFQACS